MEPAAWEKEEMEFEMSNTEEPSGSSSSSSKPKQQPQQQGHSSTTEVRGRVHAFAEEKLYVSKGSRILTRTLYDAFKAFMGGDVDFLTFSIEEFGSELYRCLKSKGGEFSTLEKKNGSVDGSKGRFWKNLCVRV